MTIAALGISIEGKGVKEAPRDLNAVAVAADKAEKATNRLAPASRQASDGVKRLGDTARTTDGALANLANRSLTGFNAVAARAAEQAAYVAREMEKITVRDLRSDDIQAYGQEMDRLRSKFNPLFAASKQYESSLDEINRAHSLGAITAQEQAAAVARLDAQYEAAARAANTLSTANKTMAGSFHTTNLMFQAQDIAMMSMMGQAPLAVALQQGMQVGGIFHQIGNGRQVVQALGGALTGLLSPINLVTIGTIALGAAGVQAFMSWVSSMGPVERSMEDHQKWLGEILKGYDDISKAVNDYLDTATRMPATLLRIDLSEQMTQTQAQLDSLRAGIEEFGLAYGSLIPVGPFQQFNQDMEILRELRDEYVAGASDAETFAGSLRSITSNNNVSPFVRELAQSLYDMVRDAADAEAQLGSLEIAMDRAGQAAQLAAQRTQMLNDTFALLGNGAGQHGGLQNVMDEGVAALDSLRRMVPEIRTTKEIAGDLVQTVLDTLPTGAARQEAEALFNTIIENEAILTARREANRSARRGGRERDPYGDLTRGAFEFISAQQIEQQALGMTAEAAQRLRFEQDLLNKAANDNIALTPVMRDELMGLAAQMAATEAQTKMLTQAANDNAALWGQVQDGVSGVLKTWMKGGDILDTISNKLINIADMLIDMAVRNLFLGAFGGGMGGGGGLLGGMIIPGILHSGGVAGADGYGHGRSFPASTWANAERYHTGGIAGLRANEVPAILERGETIIPRGASAGQQLVQVRVSLGWSKDSDGNIAPIVKGVAQDTVGAAAPVIVRTAVDQSTKAAPAAVAQYQAQRGGSDWRTM